MTPTDFMLLAGAIILIGFLADELFRRKYIPDSIILIILGMILGYFTGYLSPEIFVEFAGFMASIAVAIILYDTGLNLNLISTLKQSGPSFMVGTLSYFFSALFITIVAMLLLHWDLLYSLILGTMLGGTSAAVVAAISGKLPVSDKTKILLNVESTLTNAYALIFVLTLVDFARTGAVTALAAAHQVVASLSIALVMGLIFGLLWLKLLSKAKSMNYVHMVTLGVMFLLYAITEYLKGIGAIAAFIFGLVLGNSKTVAQMLFLDGDYRLGMLFKRFNDEISFFIRVFFFVYLGIIFVPPSDNILYLAALLIVIFALIARFLATYLTRVKDQEIVTASFPRGLSEAVVASLLLSMKFPHAETYLQIASLVILLTNIATAILLYYVIRKIYRGRALPSDKNPSPQK